MADVHPRSRGWWVLSLVYALPLAAALAFVAIRYGAQLRSYIELAIKLVVCS